jgi:hypothetical protein
MTYRTPRINRWREISLVCVAVCAMISGCITGPSAHFALQWPTPEPTATDPTATEVITVAATEDASVESSQVVQAEFTETTEGGSDSKTTSKIVQVAGKRDAADGSAARGLKGVARKWTSAPGRVFSALVRKKSETKSDGPDDPFLDSTTNINTKPSKPITATRREKTSPVSSPASTSTSLTRPNSRTADRVQTATRRKADSTFVPGFDSQMERLRAEMQSKRKETVPSKTTSIAKEDSPLDLDARPKTPLVKTDTPASRRRDLSFEKVLESTRTKSIARTLPSTATPPPTTTPEVAAKIVTPKPSVATTIVDPFLDASEQPITRSVSPSSVPVPAVASDVVANDQQKNVDFGSRRRSVRETVALPKKNVDRAIYENIPVQSADSGWVAFPQKNVGQAASTAEYDSETLESSAVEQVSATARPMPVGLETGKLSKPRVNLGVPVVSGKADLAMIVDSSTIPKRLSPSAVRQRRRFADLNSPTTKDDTAPPAKPNRTKTPAAVPGNRLQNNTLPTDKRDSVAALPVEFQFSSSNKGTVSSLKWEEEPTAAAEPLESTPSFSTSAKITWGLGMAFLIVLVLRSRIHRRFDLAR